MLQNRLKSKFLWLSILALIVMILNNYGLFQIIGMTESNFTNFIEALLDILVLFGILNNPTNKEEF